MIRTLILGASLAILGGCSSSQKTRVTGSSPRPAADSPKEYQYRDMSQGSAAGMSRPPANARRVVD